jgi:hypothetical protein
VEHVYKEEEKDKEVAEGEDEEDKIKFEEKEQQVPPKTPRKRIQKNYMLDQIIDNKDVGVETRTRIRLLEKQDRGAIK